MGGGICRRDDPLNAIVLNAIVLMSKNITHSRNIFPGGIWVGVAEGDRESLQDGDRTMSNNDNGKK
jgi:hypothetical protein